MLQNNSIHERWEIIDKLLPLGCCETEVAAIKAIMSALIHLLVLQESGQLVLSQML